MFIYAPFFLQPIFVVARPPPTHWIVLSISYVLHQCNLEEAFDRTGRILNMTVSPQSRSDPPRLLNYLTAPHVLVWSAAVASSSLPGVFDANKLIVKDADGTERYEGASGMSFQDGSMEADLPFQQLSEMFNINHFIISQANPHAVFFASFNMNTSVWNNHIIGLAHGVSLFVKNQVKSWFRHVVEMVGGRRIAPLWDTKRGFGSQFFTQEYEGRDTDISINPWNSDRSLFSAFLHLLYNPTEEEFMEWIKGAERETWKHIPAIKSHCAEEMTLDRCVQRLRKRVILESWEVRSGVGVESTTDKMGKRVPSFFTSPSLVNMGGLTIGDRLSLSDIEDHMEGSTERIMSGQATPRTSDQIEIPSGWGGMGLRGNHSRGTLKQSPSEGSGLFFMDEGLDGKESEDEFLGELRPFPRPSSGAALNNIERPYIKTSSMANFYYRKTKSSADLASAQNGKVIPSDTGQTSTANDTRKVHSSPSLDLSSHAN
jgi:predicted acylesterase/phospholipase RssA